MHNIIIIIIIIIIRSQMGKTRDGRPIGEHVCSVPEPVFSAISKYCAEGEEVVSARRLLALQLSLPTPPSFEALYRGLKCLKDNFVYAVTK